MNPPKCVDDPFFWLRDDKRENPEVIGHLVKENRYTKLCTERLQPDVDALYEELLSHVKETDDSVPYPHGDFLYYTRTEKGLSYPIHCRRAGPDAPEQIVLDVNKLAEGLSHCDVGSFSPSPDHKWLAYSLDDTGNETYKV